MVYFVESKFSAIADMITLLFDPLQALAKVGFLSILK